MVMREMRLSRTKRIQSRERSRPQDGESERSQRPAPWQSHANRIQRRGSERPLRGSICRARSGPRRGLTPPSRPTAAPYLRHTEAGDGGVCPLRRKRRLGLKGPSRARPPAPSQPSTDSPTHTTFEACPKPDVPLRLRRSSACSRRSYQLPRRQLLAMQDTLNKPLFPAVPTRFRGCTKTPRCNRSLRPEFCRSPAPRSRLRTRNQSAFSAAKASGPCADPSAAGTSGPTAARVALPEQGIRNPWSQTAHSGRRSDERRPCSRL
jgi:hypothetical protein